MIDLVITHLTHPWGPLWTLETLGDRWRSLATLGDMLENDHLGGNWHWHFFLLFLLAVHSLHFSFQSPLPLLQASHSPKSAKIPPAGGQRDGGDALSILQLKSLKATLLGSNIN